MRTPLISRYASFIAVGAAVLFGASTAMAGVYISGPLPSEFSGGFVSPNPDVHKAIGKASKEGSKLAGGLSKCYSKGAKNFSKNKATGVDACIHNTKKGVLTKFNSKVAKIASKSPLPPCHNFVLDGPAIGALVKGFNPNIYCQSPSGAFIDQTTF